MDPVKAREIILKMLDNYTDEDPEAQALILSYHALSKMVGITPLDREFEGDRYFVCPNCGMEVNRENDWFRCHHCGQRIEWSRDK